MPVRRSYQPVQVNVIESGKLLPDFPPNRIAPSDYTEKVNWQRLNGTEQKRAGWDFPGPLPDWLSEMLGRFDAAAPCEALKGIRRPNGTYAIVGCGGGKIKAFSYDDDEWLVIGTGYSVDGDYGFTYWQIEDVAGYAVFNNSRDLPCVWQVGDAGVTPIYQMREQGYAAVGNIVEYYGLLMCSNILEIDPVEMESLMNGADPFRAITEEDAIQTTRIGFERIWSNISDPRDFSAVVAGTIGLGSMNLTLAWPMASFQVGDIIRVLGAGSAGGNLTTSIVTIVGTAVTLADAAATAVTDAEVGLNTAFDAIPGSDELEGDGSAITIEKVLKNQLVSFKDSGQIHQSFYTGNVDTPFSAQRISTSDRSVRFPRALVNVRDQYLLFPGDNQFFKFQLSAQEPVLHPLFYGAQDSLFFDRVPGAGKFSVWAANNGATGEIFFAYPFGADEEEDGFAEYTARRVLVMNTNEGEESLDEIDGFEFLCAATVNKPTAGWTCDKQELWFLMGDTDGRVTLYGASNLEIFTMLRYGEVFDSIMAGSLEGFGAETLDKYHKRLTILMANPSSTGKMTLSLYGAKATNITPVLLVTKDVTNPALPGVLNAHFRRAYFKYRFVTSVAEPIRVSGHIWLIAGQDINQVSQIGS